MNYTDIHNSLLTIKQETAQGGNTRLRIYNALKAILDYCRQTGEDNSTVTVKAAVEELRRLLNEHSTSGVAHEARFQEIKNIIEDRVKTMAPKTGERFFGDDYLRRLNYIEHYESEENSIAEDTFEFTAIRSAKMNKLTTIPDSLFKYSHLSSGSFSEAQTIESAAFKGSQIYYVNKQGTQDSWNTILPKVKIVKQGAFSECRELLEVYFPEATRVSASAFQNCTRLSKIELPKCNTFVFSALTNCHNLEELNLPEQSTIFNNSRLSRLWGCTGLKKVFLPKQYEITDNTAYLFLDCISLEEVDINSMKMIPFYFFTNKHRLAKVNISDARYIGAWAFAGCVNLRTVITNLAREIDKYAFDGCVSVEELKLPVISMLREKAISRMDSLSTLTLGANISEYGYSEVSGSICDCPSLTTINVPDGWELGVQVKGISFVRCPSISKESVIGIFQKLADNTNKPAKNIALDSTVLKNITAEEQNIAKNKNYNIVKSGV